MPKIVTGRPIQPTTKIAYAWIVKHPGEVLHYSEIAEAVKLDADNVNAALGRMVTVHPEMGVERTSKGFYRYLRPHMNVNTPPAPEPEPEPQAPVLETQPELFELVVITANGTRIVRDEKGTTLYKLEEIL